MKITIAPGESLWEALEKQHIAVERPCGGRGTCRQCRVEVERYGKVLACQFREPGTYEIKKPEVQHFSVVTHSNMDPEPEGQAEKRISRTAGDSADPGTQEYPRIGVDIGTTTVALTGTWKGKTVSKSFINPQRSYGADVISRIEADCRGKGPQMREMLLDKLTGALHGIADEFAEISPVKTIPVVIGANTTMMHLLRGFSCKGLGSYPFQTVDLTLGREMWSIGDYRFDVTYLPGISAYVGADIVSGIYGLQITESGNPVLLLDLGTNGEMALGSREKLICASAAAGPAFEGSELAMQLHASGILAYLHRMKKAGVMDEYGLLADPYFDRGYPVRGVDGAPGRMTQEDIREIQMAKGAIRAGVDLLLEKYGCTAPEVERVYLAGGMGYYLNPEDAIAIGLLPAAFSGKILAAGNTCLLGIKRYFQDKPETASRRLTEIAHCAREMILAQEPDFEERYMEAMNL